MTETNKKGEEIINDLIDNYGFFNTYYKKSALWNKESTLLELEEDEILLILHLIEVDRENRRKGEGTETKKLLCNLADK